MPREGQRGPYATSSRIAELESLIAASEARLMQRIELLAQDVAAARSLATAGLRAQAQALVNVLTDEQRESTNGHHSRKAPGDR